MLILVFAFALFFVVPACVLIFRKHRKLYLQGKITRGIFARNVAVEIFGLLLAMTLAGLLGRYIAGAAAAQVSHETIKLIAGILVALLAGAGAGLLVKGTWGKLTKV